MTQGLHLNLDNAWSSEAGKPARAEAAPTEVASADVSAEALASLGIETLDVLKWGPRLRYCAPKREIDAFWAEIAPKLPPFLLYGSGDFHHLAAVWARRLTAPATVVSFDNHPDWDVRPPAWSCGAWVNRAMELPNVRHVSVWGCGNFEFDFPDRLFGNRAAMRAGRLSVRPWAARQKPAARKRFDCITRDDWRARFEAFCAEQAGRDFYVTIDLDCLTEDEAFTNWEAGLFTGEDIVFALGRLRAAGRVVGGDVCGAYSEEAYGRRPQRLAGWMDHPRLPARDRGQGRIANLAALRKIWPALAGT
jgi:arginase family enzyme